MPDHPKGTVLVVEDDRNLGTLINEVLTDEGVGVSLLDSAGPETIRAAVIRLVPDCILLDGESPRGYGTSWAEAAWVAGRDRAVPVIMLTGDADALREAEENTSARCRSAGFAGIVPKPFDLDQLVTTVAWAIQGPSNGRE